MKRIVLIFGIIAISFLNSCNSSIPVKQQEQKYETVCDTVYVKSSPRVGRVIFKTLEILKSQDNKGFEINIDSSQVNVNGLYKRKKVSGLYMNGKFIPYSKKILKEAEVKFGKNSNITEFDLHENIVSHILCEKQGIMFMKEYNKIKPCEDFPIATGPVIEPKPDNQDNISQSWIPAWLSSLFHVLFPIVLSILALATFLMLMWLLWRLLSFLFTGSSYNSINRTSTTESVSSGVGVNKQGVETGCCSVKGNGNGNHNTYKNSFNTTNITNNYYCCDKEDKNVDFKQFLLKNGFTESQIIMILPNIECMEDAEKIVEKADKLSSKEEE